MVLQLVVVDWAVVERAAVEQEGQAVGNWMVAEEAVSNLVVARQMVVGD